jgi:LPXTG-motif cell wall-anchored protein
MKRLAAVSALMVTGVLAFGASNVSAGAASAPRPSAAACTPGTASGSGGRISSAGPEWTAVGIVVPEGAHVTSIVVTTGDDYTQLTGLFGQTRVSDNQKQEQAYVVIGGPLGTKLGQYTQDVPEVGLNGDVMKASITTTVFTGNVAVSGEVIVWHSLDKTTANSLNVMAINVSWTCGSATGGGGNYPPGAAGPQLAVPAPAANAPFTASASNLCPNESVLFTLLNSSNGIVAQATDTASAGGTASATFAGVPAGDYTVRVDQTGCGHNAFVNLKIEAAASGGGGGVGINPGGGSAPTTTIVGSETPVATTVPATTVAPQVGSNGAAPTTTALGTSGTGGSSALPATGSDSFSIVQLAVVALLAGAGLVFIASIRRRKGASAL